MWRQRSGEARAWERENRPVGMLPMRNGSRHGAAQQDDVANSCISNIYHTAPVDESPRFAGTFCGIVYRATRWLKGGESLQASREALRPCNSSRTCKVRGTTVDQVSRLIGHF